ncbi:unnamed protein product [Phytomonas sp. EM1]|nr:unnamed protein product [Phytomonas sp. EM1]|eukprot:CCW60392.1 unnamed protein product [Phytomonas sp. isolate EM1]
MNNGMQEVSSCGGSQSISFDSHSFYPPTQEFQDVGTGKVLRRKEIFDRVYGQIIFPPVIGLFIDSPQVQRLRDLKQLGNSHYVYPSTTHTRFEHCLGVSHLGMHFLKQIFINQAEKSLPPALLDISDEEDIKDLWCVGIAGLCHDLGHGPLSHMFEKYVNTIRKPKGMREWSHEEASVLMLRTIWRDRQNELEEFDLNDKDLRFVELLIRGLPPKEPWPEFDVGRPAKRRFMADIIANRSSGLDVDKLDYIQRDSLSCFGSCALSSLERMFQGAYVQESEGETHICYLSKLYGTIEEVFINRVRLFELVYQHRVTQVMDQMTLDAFVSADEFFRINHEGKEYRLSEIVDHPEAYLKTGDWILNAIRYSTQPNLKQARDILDRIHCRCIYKSLGYYTASSIAETEAVSASDLISAVRNSDLRGRMQKWEKETGICPIAILKLIIFKASKDLGNADPLSRIHFFNPRNHLEEPFLFTDDHVAPDALGVRGKFRVIAVSRMPLNISDFNTLVFAFKSMMTMKEKACSVSRIETPVRAIKHPREGSYDAPLIADTRMSDMPDVSSTPKRQRICSQTPVIKTYLDE